VPGTLWVQLAAALIGSVRQSVDPANTRIGQPVRDILLGQLVWDKLSGQFVSDWTTIEENLLRQL